MKSVISVQLKKDKILFKISEKAEQEEIIKVLNKKLPDLKKLYQDAKTPILVTGKVLKNREIEEIQEIIETQLKVPIEFDMPKALGLANITRTFEKETLFSETTFHRGSLRSGQKLEKEGSIVVIGDVNSGAEVIASDNIVVLGSLRGLAHAGAKGNKQAIIAAGTLGSVQIRIANIVKEVGRDEEIIRKQVYINVKDDQIQIQ